MAGRTRTRGRRWLVAALLPLAGAGTAVAEPAALPHTISTTSRPLVEVYYGTTKVTPAEADPVVPAAATNDSRYREPLRPGEALVETLHAVRDGSKSVSDAAATLLDNVSARVLAVPPEPRQIVFTPAPPAAQPTVVVIREPAADARPGPAAEPARGAAVGVDVLAALALCGVAGYFGYRAWERRVKPPEPVAAVAPPPAPVPLPAPVAVPVPVEPGVVLMGMYDAGPLPATAQKFDLGPTYHDDLRVKKQAVETSDQAAVEFVLNQNLALLAALGAAEPAVA